MKGDIGIGLLLVKVMYCGTLISDESHLFKEFASDESYTSCNREVIGVIRIGGW